MDVSHASTFMFQEKSMKKMVLFVLSSDQYNMHLPLPYSSGSTMNFDDNFLNIMFDKKNKLDAIFAQLSLQTMNVNTSFGHVLNNFHNYLIYITYVVDPKYFLDCQV
jgi:hypothetical protein